MNEQIQLINSTDLFKLLGDPKKLAILRLLMAEPATLSQIGAKLGDHPAKIRHHLKKLESAGLAHLTSTRIVRGFIEKYYQASSQAYLINCAILPYSDSENTFCLMGSNDIALSILAQSLREGIQPLELMTLSVGSLEGLVALRQGYCHLAACHLAEKVSNQFNLNYVSHIFPGRKMVLITLAHREQGLLVQRGNPLGLIELADLSQQKVTMVNRQPGSGTRIWLDNQLSAVGQNPSTMSGYDQFVSSHYKVAESVAEGSVDVGIGLLAAARHFDIGFVPLFKERFDLVAPIEALDQPFFQKVNDILNSVRFHRQVEALGGYDTANTGVIWEVDG